MKRCIVKHKKNIGEKLKIEQVTDLQTFAFFSENPVGHAYAKRQPCKDEHPRGRVQVTKLIFLVYLTKKISCITKIFSYFAVGNLKPIRL